MNEMFEKELLMAAEPYLKNGRKGDMEHTLAGCGLRQVSAGA